MNLKRLALLPLLLLGLSIGTTALHSEEPDSEGTEPIYVDRHVAILSVYKTFDAALADAEKISKASKMPFSMEGRVYDKKRGLIYPDDFDDEVFAGSYVARRFDTTILKDGQAETSYLSVEKSDAYKGFKPGFYMVVAGISETRDEALKRAEKFKTWAPTAYAKKTKIYVGCMH